MSRGAWLAYLQFYRGSRRTLVACVALAVAQVILLLPIPLLVRRAFDEAIPGGSLGDLVVLGAAVFGLQALGGVLTLFSRRLTLRTTKTAIQRVRQAATETLYRMSRGAVDRVELTTIHDNVVHQSDRVDIMTHNLLVQFLPGAVLCLGIGAVLATLNLKLFLLTLSFSPLVAGVGNWLSRGVRRHAIGLHSAFERFSTGTLHILKTLDLAQCQNAEEWELGRQHARLTHLREANTGFLWWSALHTVTQGTLIAAAGAVILVAGGSAVIGGAMSLGEVISFFAGLALVRPFLNNMLVSVPKVLEGSESLRPLMALIEAEHDEPYRGGQRPVLTGHVVLRSVAFSYDETAVLHDVSLEIEPGSVVGLVGDNGSGKTTVVNLILGFYRPQRGCLLADRVPYDELDIRWLRRTLGVVTQVPTLIPGTVRDNIAYGQPRASMAAIEEASRLATASRFVEHLPRGYDTEVGEDGARLSGGQRQRLILARALLRKPRLLILDEPGIHLDDRSLHEVLDNLTSLDFRPALLLVSHLPAVVELADRLYLLEDGRTVAAQGTPSPVVSERPPAVTGDHGG